MSEPWKSEPARARAELIVVSYRRLLGHDLVGVPGGLTLSQAVFEAPFVIVSHGVEADPILNYGNRCALELWEMDWDTLTRTPSRYTAETPDRAERARLLEAVTRDGFIQNYAGVRISSKGRRFRIEQATVWNLTDSSGVYRGQAATFDKWEFLDGSAA